MTIYFLEKSTVSQHIILYYKIIFHSESKIWIGSIGSRACPIVPKRRSQCRGFGKIKKSTFQTTSNLSALEKNKSIAQKNMRVYRPPNLDVEGRSERRGIRRDRKYKSGWVI